MNSNSLYDELSELNNNMYNSPKDFKNWKYLEEYSDNTGILIRIYEKDNQKVFIIKGTDIISIKDWTADFCNEV